MLKGFTILEALLVVVLLSLIVVAIAPFFGTTVASWELKDRQLEVLQNGRVGMDKMVREIRWVRRFETIQSDYIRFINTDSTTLRFRLRNNQLQMRTGGSSFNPLAEPVDSLTFTYYDADDNQITAGTGVTGEVRSVEIVMVVSDSEGKVAPVPLTSRITVRKDLPSLAINEINYNPPGGGANERRREWIELRNFSSNPIDVQGWSLEVRADTDVIQGYQGGTTIIPAGSYAIITANNTQVYTFYGEPPPGTIKLQGNDNNLRLNDNWDEVILLDAYGAPVRPVRYDDNWGADGNGYTLERKDYNWAPNDQDNWEESSDTGTYTLGADNTTGSYP